MGKGRAPCCDKKKVRTGPWSPAEDLRLINFIQKHGHSNWRALPKQAGLSRCGKSCRLRWINYLRPDVKRGNFTPEEEQTIIELHNSIGNKWSKIASCLPGRTDNEIKNVWNTHLKKRLVAKKSSTTIDCHKTEGKASKMDCSSASSSSVSSFNTTAREENMEKLLTDDRVRETQFKEKPEFTQVMSSKQSKENGFSHSSSSSCASDVSSLSHDTGPKQELLCAKSLGSTTPQLGSSDDHVQIDVPSEFDVDFWELLDFLDPLQSNKTAQQQVESINLPFVEEKTDGEVEFRKWLRFLENELGLATDGDQQIMIASNSQYIKK